MIKGNIRPSRLLQSPFIQIKAKVTMPGTTNGMPNIKEERKFVLPPSAKKIGSYIKNQIFGSDIVTQTDGLDVNWIMPTLGQALEEAIYDKEAFIYIHKFDNKVYLECLRKCDIHNLEQKYDKVISLDIIQDFDGEENDYSLKRHIENKGNGTSVITFKAYEKSKKDKEWNTMPLWKFNKIELDVSFSISYKLSFWSDLYFSKYKFIFSLAVSVFFFSPPNWVVFTFFIIS